MASLLNILEEETQQRKQGKANQDDNFELDFDDFGASSTTIDNQLFNFGSSNNSKAGQLQGSKDAKKAAIDDFDDDFDYEDNEQPQAQPSSQHTLKKNEAPKEDPKILQDQLKKLALSKEVIRKKNYIGDSVIAERGEQEEGENPDSQRIGESQKASNYVQRFGKISQLYDESTKEYKTQQKELGIKKAEEAILRKAKEEIKKIESYKQKFRQSAFGGVITNSLSASVDKIKLKHAYNESENKQKYQALGESDGSDQIQEKLEEIQIDFADEQANQMKAKKKKKKKKKQVLVIKEDQEEFDETEFVIDEVKPMPKVREYMENPIPQKKQQSDQERDGVDWDELNQRNVRKVFEGYQMNDEEDKLDIERRNKQMNYDEAIQFFASEVDLSKEIEQVANIKEDFRNIGFLQRLSMCFSNPKLQDDLNDERDFLFALTRVKLDTTISEHEVIIKTIYKRLTGNTQCRLIGSHWGDIGFQGNDPKTDVRGAGMLGLLHLLFFVSKYYETAKSILVYSNKEKVEFPMAVRMFEFSVLVIGLMREGKLYSLCNEKKEVMETVAHVYSSLFMHFVCTYIEKKMNITHMNELNTEIERAAKSNLKKTIGPYFQVSDLEALKLLKQSQKRQSQIQQDRLKQLAQQSEKMPEFQISQSKNPAKTPSNKHIGMPSKASQYASSGGDSQPRRSPQKQQRSGASEFSAV